MILADVAREDASVILSDLKELGIHQDGRDHGRADRHPDLRAAPSGRSSTPGAPADAVVWEEVEARTSENVELSGVFLAFMVLAGLLAAVGIYQDSPILIVGAMVVGPEFGPLAGFCVALVQRRGALAMRSARALAVGFPLAIAAVYVDGADLQGDRPLRGERSPQEDHSFANIISAARLLRVLRRRVRRRRRDAEPQHREVRRPDRRADLGHDDPRGGERRPRRRLPGLGRAWRGSVAQLAINLGSIVAAGTGVLAAQRALYLRRRRQHLDDPERPPRACLHGGAQRRPDLDLRPDLLDDRVGELRRRRLAAEVEGLDAARGRLERAS